MLLAHMSGFAAINAGAHLQAVKAGASSAICLARSFTVDSDSSCEQPKSYIGFSFGAMNCFSGCFPVKSDLGRVRLHYFNVFACLAKGN